MPKKISVEVGSRAVDGHAPGETFSVDDDDPRLRAWLRAGNVTLKKVTKKKVKK